MTLVVVENIGNVGVITFSNPKKRNALSLALLNEMLSALNRFRDTRVPVIIIRAEKGATVWSSGLDATELPRSGRAPLEYDTPLERLLRAIEQFPGPVIAMVQSGVWGGACDLAITCDMIIGDPTCTFAITPARIGLPYNASGILHFINRVGINVAKEMFFIAELGLNPKARLRGSIIENESVLGTTHLALRDNSKFGGRNLAPAHIDLVLRKSSIHVDRERVPSKLGRFANS